MFLKNLSIYNDNKPIREINFRKGINLIVDESSSANKTDSGNSVGKTTVLRLIDFLKSSSIVRVKGKRVLELFCVEIKFLIDLDVGKTKSFFLNSICFNIKISSYSINNKTSCNNPVI